VAIQRCCPTSVPAQNQQQSLAQAPCRVLLLLPDGGHLYQVFYRHLHKSQRRQQAPWEGSCWGDGAGASHRVHPPCSPFCSTPCAQLHLACAGLSPHMAQAPHGCPFPPAYLLAGDAALLQRHWGVSFLHPALPLYSPLLTSLRQATALQFCLSSTGEASEETRKSSRRRLLLHLALSSGRGYPMKRSGKAKGAQRVLSSGFEQAAAHSWI